MRAGRISAYFAGVFVSFAAVGCTAPPAEEAQEMQADAVDAADCQILATHVEVLKENLRSGDNLRTISSMGLIGDKASRMADSADGSVAEDLLALSTASQKAEDGLSSGMSLEESLRDFETTYNQIVSICNAQ